jgi:hypothetical protein
MFRNPARAKTKSIVLRLRSTIPFPFAPTPLNNTLFVLLHPNWSKLHFTIIRSPLLLRRHYVPTHLASDLTFLFTRLAAQTDSLRSDT